MQKQKSSKQTQHSRFDLADTIAKPKAVVKPKIARNRNKSDPFLNQDTFRQETSQLVLPTISSVQKVEFSDSMVAGLKYHGHRADFIVNDMYKLREESSLQLQSKKNFARIPPIFRTGSQTAESYLLK
jgi:hypothetical protein